MSNLIKLCIEAEDNTEKNNIYNIGSNIGYSILDLLEVITQITSKRINYIDMPARIIDCDYNVLDITKIKKDLNWEPKISLKAGLEIMWNHLSKSSIDKNSFT